MVHGVGRGAGVFVALKELLCPDYRQLHRDCKIVLLSLCTKERRLRDFVDKLEL